MSKTNICAQTAQSNGIPHRRQYVELVEPLWCSEERESVEAINRHTSKPTSDEDTKWYAAGNATVDIIFHLSPKTDFIDVSSTSTP
mgnify:CR=1 FL=1